jgi:adenosylcobinamide hydrolase
VSGAVRGERLPFEAPGVTLRRTLPSARSWRHHLLLELPGPCAALSSAPLGGGFSRPRFVLSCSVERGWCSKNPAGELQRYARALGLPPTETLGLLTAVSMAALQTASAARAGWRVHALVTAGVGNAAAAGGRDPLEAGALGAPGAGTVNLIVLLGGALEPAALVGAVQSATEAKTAALQAAGIRTPFGELATGTTTDTVSVLNLAAAPTSPYAGLATTPGRLIADTVYAALSRALSAL